MKKKLLSLVLAGAMVASTSVSAFADTTITNPDTEEPKTNVSITGKVENESGQLPTGNFNVTIPTAASFTVNKDGVLIGTDIKITNNGSQDVEVYAEKFIDTQKGTGINVVAESDLKSNDRRSVSLRLSGDVNTLYLKSESENDHTNAGLYKDNALTERVANESDLKLANVQSKNSTNLNLSGSAGDNGNQVEEAVSNNFTLTLKIKKSTRQ